MLTNWKIQYLTAGGNFYEKLHPATYFTFLAFALLLLRSRGPIGEIDRHVLRNRSCCSSISSCWLLLLVQMFVLERPFTVIIDTFLLPVVLCLVIWQLAPSQQKARWSGPFISLILAQRRDRILRIFLRSPADPADARQTSSYWANGAPPRCSAIRSRRPA